MTFTVTYCNEGDVQSVLSGFGVIAAIDDDRSGTAGPGETNYFDDVIQQVQSKINFFLVQWYQLSTVPGNTWIRWCAAVMSACQLLRRRGESPPDGLVYQENQYLEWLEEVRTNHALVPPDGANDMKLILRNSGMTMSNLTVDQRFRTAKVRFIPRLSSGQDSTGQFGIPRFPDYASSVFTQ